MLGKNLLTVRADSEYAAGAGNKLKQLNFGSEFLFQLVLQTGGSGLVVSGCAVFNGDFHGFLLMRKKEPPQDSSSI